MDARHTDGRAQLALPLYFVALLLLVVPLIDFVMSIGATRIGDIQWRFGTAGLFSGFLLTPLVGVAIAVSTAAIREHQRVQRGIAITNLVIAIVLLLVLAFFALDVLQLHSRVPAAQQGAFRNASLKAAVKYLLSAIAFFWLAVVGFRVSREEQSVSATGRAHPEPIFITQPTRSDG
jgi:hypothetical protein